MPDIPLEYTADPTRREKGETLRDYVENLYWEFHDSTYRDKKFQDIEDGRKRYDEDLDPKDFPWEGCSNKTMGLTQIAVDGLAPRIFRQVIGEKDFVQVLPVGREDMEKAEAVKSFMEWAAIQNMKLPEEIKPALHDLTMDGTKFCIPVYEEEAVVNRQREVRPVYVTADGAELPIPPEALQNPSLLLMLGQAGVRQEFRDQVSEKPDTRFRVSLEWLELSDTFWPDTGRGWDDQPFLRYIYPTYEELLLLQEQGIYFDISDDLVQGRRRSENEEFDANAEEKDIQTTIYTDECRLLEGYVQWEGEWMLCTIAIDADARIVRQERLSDLYWHGRKPIQRLDIFRVPNEQLGTGIPRKIQHYHMGIDDFFNQMVDAGTIENLPWGFYTEGPGMTHRGFSFKIGEMMPLPKGSSVYFPHTNSKSLNYMSYIELVLGFFERKIALLDHTLSANMGRGGAGTETYSGMALIVQEGNIQHQYRGETLRDQMARILADCRELYAQYMPMEVFLRVFEGNRQAFRRMTALEIQGNFDLALSVSDSSANKMLNRKEKMELYQVLAQNPVNNLAQLTEELLKAYDVKNLDDWIDPKFQAVLQALSQAPELEKMIGQYMEQKQQQAGDEEVGQEAQANIRRQQVERDVELQSGLEDQKIMNQVRERIKRQAAEAAVMPGEGR